MERSRSPNYVYYGSRCESATTWCEPAPTSLIAKSSSNQFDEADGPFAMQHQHVCHDTLDFVSVPGFPSAICVFALTHSRRIVFQR
jgi:hypothetical protein